MFKGISFRERKVKLPWPKRHESTDQGGRAWLSAVETLQSTELSYQCFASTSPSNTVPHGGPASHHCPPPPPWVGVPVHFPMPTSTLPSSTQLALKGQEKLQHPSVAQGGHCLSPAMSLARSVVSAEILVISRRARPVHTLCLLAPVHPEC